MRNWTSRALVWFTDSFCLLVVLFWTYGVASLFAVDKQIDNSQRTSERENKHRQSVKRVKASIWRSVWRVRVTDPLGAKMSADNRDDDERRHQDMMRLEGRQAAFNFMLMIFSGLGFCAAFYQGCQMIKQIETDNRAWLAIEDAKLDEEHLEEGWGLRVLFTINNVGIPFVYSKKAGMAETNIPPVVMD